jgi:hypothetical protein
MRVVRTRGKTELGDGVFHDAFTIDYYDKGNRPERKLESQGGLSLPRFDDNVSKFVTYRYAWASFGHFLVNTVIEWSSLVTTGNQTNENQGAVVRSVVGAP